MTELAIPKARSSAKVTAKTLSAAQRAPWSHVAGPVTSPHLKEHNGWAHVLASTELSTPRVHTLVGRAAKTLLADQGTPWSLG